MNKPAPAAAPKQLNIRLPEDLHRGMKARCVMDGHTLAYAIEDLCRQYMAGRVKVTPKKPTAPAQSR